MFKGFNMYIDITYFDIKGFDMYMDFGDVPEWL